ncbi:MAG: alginate export family protein [Planctomycetales bacterium]|nr:alginate export family protein [Planctomycetales bacterium]
MMWLAAAVSATVACGTIGSAEEPISGFRIAEPQLGTSRETTEYYQSIPTVESESEAGFEVPRATTSGGLLELSAESTGKVACASGCRCAKCDKAKMAALKKKAATSHRPVFYDNDFSYLNDPCWNECLLGDRFKQLDVHCGKLDVGGQFRLRYHHEEGMNKGAAERFQPTTDDFLLERLRLYANYRRDFYRVFVEGIFADSSFHSLPPRGIDRNHGDFLNLFLDVDVTQELTMRVGRQELIYGNQRLVSPLDWANTRRTFEGVKGIWKHDDLRVDAFWTSLVDTRPFELDQADWKQQFYGMYAVYNLTDKDALDLYYLGYDNHDLLFSIHTFGARLNGSQDEWLYEVEGAYQGGDAAGANVDQSAGFVTVGLGRKLKRMPWDMTLWGYFDYASGDVPGGDFTGFNHLFPLAHKYLGFIDAVQRSNIQSPNLLLTMNPTEKWNLLFWYYVFQSDTTAPVPSVGGTPSQNAGRNFGQELDILATYKISPRSDLQFGWSHLWRGSKINNPRDADFTYVQWVLNF